MTHQGSSLLIQIPALPHPQIPEIQDGFLNMITNPGDATAIVGRWAAAHIWLRVEGQKSSGEEQIIELLNNHEISSEQFESGLKEFLLREELLQLANNSTLTIRCKINFNGSSDESTAIEFPALQLTLKTQDESWEDFTDFNDETLGGWTKGNAGKEIQFINSPITQGFHLFNNTSEQTDNHSGTILEKMFPSITGKKYEFTIDAVKENPGSPNSPELVLCIDNQDSERYIISNTNWTTYTFSAIANSSSMTVKLKNLQSKWNGNDFSLDNFRVKLLS